MDIPLHPLVSAEITRGRAFLDTLAQARAQIKGARIAVPCPNGKSSIVFDGDGVVVQATLDEDFFEDYRGKVGEVLTAMCSAGYALTSEKITGAVQDAVQAAQVGGQ
ncbi:Uncharacterised protein [Mycobacteroides abscessus subsp. abscessus]|uniref:hypothetical protein n=1 Tax=Mycobacteroides abscessus TaxID=36809 RepID=UPI00092A32A5|nr:hypothetical protein [Mycobacteroides abscessus]SIJ21864.1 Uncharacterised protein [Mycobacteroides abscessus subsp. abscessus]SLH38727.1 Uncharacterised protein [Mycobacteroides abscessus subsp. abscessus]